MKFIDKIKKTTLNYRKDEDGQIAIAVAVSMTVMIAVVGSALDYSVVSNADMKSQSIADASALAAAIYVKNHDGEIPKDKSEGLIGTYTASELGYEFPNWVTGGAAGVTVKVEYDNVNRQSVATVSGATKPSFSQVMGKTSLPFVSKATVKYDETKFTDPASVALVLDGSGSMAWDDTLDTNPNNDHNEWRSTTPGAMARNDSLKDAAKGFMDDLKAIQDKDTSVRYLRTGLYVYNSDYLSLESEPLTWGALSTSNLSKLMLLRKLGGTNSYAAMKEARKDMEDEGPIHEAENGADDPLKFVILMTDGVNDTTDQECVTVDKPAHNHWERRYFDYWSWSYRTEVSHSYYRPSRSWSLVSVAAGEETEQECTPISSYDDKTLQECTKFANMGAKVYTIGYGLEAGRYHRRDGIYENWFDNTTAIYDGYHVDIPQETTDRAYQLLEACATSTGGEFIPAENAQELTSAFDNIGQKIIAETIRISD